MAEQRVQAQPRGGSVGWYFSSLQSPLSTSPGSQRLKIPLGGGGRHGRCVFPWCEFSPTRLPPAPFSLWPWAEQAFLILGLVGFGVAGFRGQGMGRAGASGALAAVLRAHF